jgi:hypothetical protein
VREHGEHGADLAGEEKPAEEVAVERLRAKSGAAEITSSGLQRGHVMPRVVGLKSSWRYRLMVAVLAVRPPLVVNRRLP